MTAHLTPKDHLFLLSGSNDIKEAEFQVQVYHHKEARKDFISHSKHVNIYMVSTPRRLDKTELNTHMDAYNEEVKKMCLEKSVPYIDINAHLNEEDYSRDPVSSK